MAKFSFFSMNELLASPRLRPIIERLQPAAVIATVKGVYEDVIGEMSSAAAQRRIPELADLTDKILARLQDVEKKGNSLLIDASGVIFPNSRFELAPGRMVLDEMMWRIDVSAADFNSGENPSDADNVVRGAFPDLSKTTSEFCSATGAEDVLFFASPEQAEIAAVQTFCTGKKLGIARRDLYEDSAGVRFADRLFLSRDDFAEVGASNGARLSDFIPLCTESTGLIWIASGVHSDLKPTLSDADLTQIREAARSFKIPVLCRRDFAPLLDLSDSLNCAVTPLPRLLQLDADLFLVGGGQLLGGPNCGILAGRKVYLDAIRRRGFDQLFAPHQADLAGLAKTIRLSRDPEEAEREIPVLRMTLCSPANLRNRAERLIPQILATGTVTEAEPVSCATLLYPSARGVEIPSAGVAVKPAKNNAEEFESFLEKAKPGLKGRVADGRIILDLKTVPPRWDHLIVNIFEGIYGG